MPGQKLRFEGKKNESFKKFVKDTNKDESATTTAENGVAKKKPPKGVAQIKRNTEKCI